MADFSIRRDLLEELLGLVPRTILSTPSLIRLGQAHAVVGDKTMGAAAVLSQCDWEKGRLRTHYWRMGPDGQQTPLQKLFELDWKTIGGEERINKLAILGRRLLLPDEIDGAEEGEWVATERNVNRAFGAIQSIHEDLRKGKFPPVGEIFLRKFTRELVGEKLTLIGFDSEGKTNFRLPTKKAPVEAPFELPRDIAELFLSGGRNNLDPGNEFEGPRPQSTPGEEHGLIFRSESRYTPTPEALEAHVQISSFNMLGRNPALIYPNFLKTNWTTHWPGWCGPTIFVCSMLISVTAVGKRKSAHSVSSMKACANRCFRNIRLSISTCRIFGSPTGSIINWEAKLMACRRRKDG